MSQPPASLPGLLQRALGEALADCSDRQLLERFATAGDDDAFAALVDRHGPMLLGLCRRWLRDVHLAEDVLQATFLVLARKADSIRRNNLAGWLYRVAHRLVRQVRLAEAARSRREQQVAVQRDEAVAGDPAWEELLRVLDEELQRLPDCYRAPLVLCFLQERTQDEAARQLGWSLSTLRRRLERGRERLRLRLARRGATLGGGLSAGLLAPSGVRAALSAELRQRVLETVRAGLTGGTVPAAVALLAKGGWSTMSLTKLVLGSVLTLALGGVLAGVCWRSGPAMEAGEAPKAPRGEPAAEPAVARDCFKDPLPNGTVARLGTVVFRHGLPFPGASLTYTADGQCLISAGGGRICRWDLATGQALVSLGEPWQLSGSAGTELVSADGKLGLLGVRVDLPGGQSKRQWTEYDLKTGKERRSYRLDFPGRTPAGLPPPSVVAPDGKSIAELGRAGQITLRDAGGAARYQLEPAAAPHVALAFLPHGKGLLAGDARHTFRIFDLASGKEQRSFGDGNANVLARLAVSPDGKWLVTAGGKKGNDLVPVAPHDRFLRLWDLERGTQVRTLDFPEDFGVQGLVFTPDSRTLLAGLQTRSQRAIVDVVRSWDVASGKPGRSWTNEPALGAILAVSPDGKELATLNHGGCIRFFDLATGRETRLRQASPCSLSRVCFRPDGKTVLTFGIDFRLREWDTVSGRLLDAAVPCQTEDYHPTFAPTGQLLATSDRATALFGLGGGGNVVRLHDTKGKKVLEKPGRAPVLSPNGKRLALRAREDQVQVLDIGTGLVIQTLDVKEDAGEPLGFSADGQTLVVRGETVSTWDVPAGTKKTSWSLVKNQVLEASAPEGQDYPIGTWCSALAPDGNTVVLAVTRARREGKDLRPWVCRLLLFETATGKLLHQVDGEEDAFAALTFSPDGKLLAGGGTWLVRVWNTGTGKPAGQFEGQRSQIMGLTFTPDGKQLASASADSTVLIWDVSALGQ